MRITHITGLVLVAIGITAGTALLSVVSTPAHANSGRNAVCIVKMPWADGAKTNETANQGVQQWMNEQLAAGKTDFVTAMNAAQAQSLCAW